METPNTLELAGQVLHKAREQGLEEALTSDLINIGLRFGMTQEEIDKAIAPPPYGEYPVVYYP